LLADVESKPRYDRVEWLINMFSALNDRQRT